MCTCTHTFRRITRLVIFGEPFQVLVFDPWHPGFILLVITLLDPFGVGLVLLFGVRQGVEAPSSRRQYRSVRRWR